MKQYLKNSARKLLEITNNFTNVVGQRTNLKKSILFLYTNNTHTENNNGHVLNHNDLKENKISEISLTKEMENPIMKTLNLGRKR